MKKGNKALATLGVFGLLIVLIAIYVVAQGAKNLAQENRSMIDPNLEIQLIAGGSEEFGDLFKEGMKNVSEELSLEKLRADYLWITVLVKNAGLAEVEDVRTVVELDSEIYKIYTAQPKKYYGKIKLEEKKENKVNFIATSLGEGNSFAIFLGLQPEIFEKRPFGYQERQLWKRDYRIFFQRLEVTSGDFQEVAY